MVLIAFMLAGAALMGTGYWLGSAHIAARLADATLEALCHYERWALRRGRAHPLTWYPLQAAYALRIATELALAPRATMARLREVRRLRPSRLPQPVLDAVAEAAVLHLPDSHHAYDHAVFNVRRDYGHDLPLKYPDARVTLPYVAFVGQTAETVRLSLGTPHGPFNQACEAPDDPETNDRLFASVLRVQSALNDLAPLPVVARLYVPLPGKEAIR